MKYRILTLLIIIGFLPMNASANWLKDICEAVAKVYGINLDMLKQDKFQTDQMKKISSGLTGTHEYGNQFYNPKQFYWGSGTNDWQSILAIANRGGGSGELGGIIRQLSNQFPISHSLGSPNETENKYYLLQAQTSLASRASAQVAFQQMSQEAETMQQLHKMIDKAPDNKSAVDLNNRLAAENADINIQQARLLAVLVQQASIDSQEKANRAKESAEFFDIK